MRVGAVINCLVDLNLDEEILIDWFRRGHVEDINDQIITDEQWEIVMREEDFIVSNEKVVFRVQSIIDKLIASSKSEKGGE